MARLAEDGGNYRAPAAKKPTVKKPVKRVTQGQIAPQKRDLGNQPYRAPAKRTVRKPTRTTTTRRTAAPVSRVSSRGSTSGYSTKPVVSRPRTGATAGGTIAPTVAKPVAKPVAPAIPQFDDAYRAGDTTYTKQNSDLLAALKAYDAQALQDTQAYDTSYGETVKRLGEDQTKGASDLAEDYASRGLLESGIYANALNDYNADFGKQTSDLARAQQLYKQDLGNERTNFVGNQEITRQQAYQDALNRYNLKYK